MANRQHGRGRPAGGPGAAAKGPGVPAGSIRGPSRRPGFYGPEASGTPSAVEPDVRRWPHPVTGDVPEQTPEPALHYIRCALSYQNQLLAEIKTLLEQIAAEEETETP